MRKMRTWLKIGLLICLALILVPFNLSCGSSSEKNTVITSLQGELTVKKAGSANWVKAEVKMLLNKGDSIKTGAEASAKITFFDGSTIELKANTQIEFTDLINEQAKQIQMKQEIGETISKVEKLVDSASKYEIETPTAVAGVRGSSMRVSVSPDGTTQVQNLEGKISVTAQGIEVVIPVGSSSTVKPGQAPASPVLNPQVSTNFQIYSALGSYSTANGNPNGVWSYGWMSVDLSKFNLYVDHNAYQWYGPLGGDLTPCIWINNEGMRYGVPGGWLSLHPGPGTEPSILRWTSPKKGKIQVSGQFLPGDGGKMSVSILHNSAKIWNATDSGNFDLPLEVTSGDTINFIVYGGYGYGNTPISANISYK